MRKFTTTRLIFCPWMPNGLEPWVCAQPSWIYNFYGHPKSTLKWTLEALGETTETEEQYRMVEDFVMFRVTFSRGFTILDEMVADVSFINLLSSPHPRTLFIIHRKWLDEKDGDAALHQVVAILKDAGKQFKDIALQSTSSETICIESVLNYEGSGPCEEPEKPDDEGEPCPLSSSVYSQISNRPVQEPSDWKKSSMFGDTSMQPEILAQEESSEPQGLFPDLEHLQQDAVKLHLASQPTSKPVSIPNKVLSSDSRVASIPVGSGQPFAEDTMAFYRPETEYGDRANDETRLNFFEPLVQKKAVTEEPVDSITVQGPASSQDQKMTPADQSSAEASLSLPAHELGIRGHLAQLNEASHRPSTILEEMARVLSRSQPSQPSQPSQNASISEPTASKVESLPFGAPGHRQPSFPAREDREDAEQDRQPSFSQKELDDLIKGAPLDRANDPASQHRKSDSNLPSLSSSKFKDQPMSVQDLFQSDLEEEQAATLKGGGKEAKADGAPAKKENQKTSRRSSAFEAALRKLRPEKKKGSQARSRSSESSPSSSSEERQ